MVTKKKVRLAIIVLAVISVAAIGGGFGVSGIGYWLVVADPLAPARAIVVLSGHLPFRAMQAASIYKDGWAPEVWITRPFLPAEETALARIGVQFVREETYNEKVLERLGVPHNVIRILDGRVRNTAEEVQVIGRELERMSGKKVIIVTSKPHTRRVRAIWRALVGTGSEVIVRYSKDDPFHPARWWRNTKDALAVSREVFGLMNVWAGFPVQPNRP